MRALAPVTRVVDDNVKVRVKSDGSGGRALGSSDQFNTLHEWTAAL